MKVADGCVCVCVRACVRAHQRVRRGQTEPPRSPRLQAQVADTRKGSCGQRPARPHRKHSRRLSMLLGALWDAACRSPDRDAAGPCTRDAAATGGDGELAGGAHTRAQSRGEGGACRTEGSCEGVAATGPSSGHRQGPGQRDALQDTGSHSDFHDPGSATAQELVSSHRDWHSKSPGQRESREVSSGPRLNEKGG